MSQSREPVEFVISVSILESYVFALNITKLIEKPYNLVALGGHAGSSTAEQPSDFSQLWRLLRVGGRAKRQEKSDKSQRKKEFLHCFSFTASASPFTPIE